MVINHLLPGMILQAVALHKDPGGLFTQCIGDP